MVRIPDLPDLSRFVQRADKVRVYNTIHLLVGEESVEVSGPVISQASQTLEDLVGNQPELYLDQFTGEIEGIRDVVEMLYGGDVELNEGNYKTVLKFSVVYDVEKLYKLCIGWLKEHVATLDLFNLIQFGMFIKSLGDDEIEKCDVLDLCTSFIKDDVKDELMELSKSWMFADSIDFIKFLIQEDILYYSSPILTSWIRNDKDANIILTELELKDLVKSLWRFGVRSSDLLDKMSERSMLVDTIKKLNSTQSINYRECVGAYVNTSHFTAKDLSMLLSLDYCSFELDKVLTMEKDYKLNHFQFVELAIHWIKNKPGSGISQDDLNMLWDCFQQLEPRHLTYHVTQSLLPLKPLPVLEKLQEDQCKFFFFDYQILKTSGMNPIKVDKQCSECTTKHNFSVNLVDKTPCYELDTANSHCEIGHVYLSFRVNNEFICYSLVTNTYSAVVRNINECWESNSAVFLVALDTCGKK